MLKISSECAHIILSKEYYCIGLTLHEKLVGCVSPDNSGVYIIVYAMERGEEFSLYSNVGILPALQEYFPRGPYI
jgi:hypothetical protein